MRDRRSAPARDHDYLRSLGIEPVTYGPDAAERIRHLTVDAVLDTAGNGALAAAPTEPGARVASIAEIGLPGVTPVFCRLAPRDFQAIADLAEAGKLTVRIGATFPFDRAADAQRALAKRTSPGKIVVLGPGSS